MSLPKFTALLAAGAMVATFTLGAIAQDGAMMTADQVAAMSVDEIVEAREAGMKENGGLMRQAGGLTGDAAVAAADTMIKNFANFHVLFPEGSINDESKALPAIWESEANYAEFMGWFDTALEGANALKTAAIAGDADAYGAALKTIGGTCGTCHQKYRAE